MVDRLLAKRREIQDLRSRGWRMVQTAHRDFEADDPESSDEHVPESEDKDDDYGQPMTCLPEWSVEKPSQCLEESDSKGHVREQIHSMQCLVDNTDAGNHHAEEFSSSQNVIQEVRQEKMSETQHSISNHVLQSKIRVLGTSNEETRIYDKKQYCPYCLVPQSKLPRHLESQHHQEPEVVKLLSLPKEATTDRQLQLLRLRNLGNFRHNSKVLREQEGDLVVVYRPNTDVSYADYLPCEHCLGFYARSDIYRHTAECKLNDGSKGKHEMIQETSRFLVEVPYQGCAGLHEVVSKMPADSITQVAKGDVLIMTYGQKLYNRYGHNVDQHEIIRRQIRDLGSLLSELRKGYENVRTLSDFISPRYFQAICNSVQSIANVDDKSNAFAAAAARAAADRIDRAVKGAARTVQSAALQNGDKETAERAADLLTCFVLENIDDEEMECGGSQQNRNDEQAESVDTGLCMERQPICATKIIVELGPKRTGRKCKKKRPWTEDEKAAIKKCFLKSISLRRLPGKAKIEECQRREPILRSRQWKNIKDFIRNTITRKSKP